MFDLIDEFINILKDLLPDKRDPIKIWLTKLLVTISIILLIVGITFNAIRETRVGRDWGINSPAPIPELTTKEYRDISTVVYTYLIRMREEVRSLRSFYFIVAFDKNGDINFADQSFDRIGVFSWYFPDARYISFQTFEEVFTRVIEPYTKQLTDESGCISGKLSDVDSERFKQASPAWLSNRFVVCPTPLIYGNKFPYGAVASFWVDDPARPALSAEAKKSTELAARNINNYLMNRPELKLQEKMKQ